MRDYELFMRDYLQENSPNDYEQLSAYDEAVDKEDVYKENYFFQTNLQEKYVTPVLAKQKNRDIVIDFIGSFIDKHIDQLSTSGPIYTWTFGEKELAPIYNLFDLNNEELIRLYDEMIKETYYGKISKSFTGWTKSAPQKLLITAMLADAYQHNYPDIIECCEYMYAFTEYPILYRDYWKLGVQADIMNYTIEHMSNKYKLRQMSSFQELLKYDANTSVKIYIPKFAPRCADNVYMDLMRRMRNQFNSKMRNISREYYKNVANNASQHVNVTAFDDGSIADQEGHTTNVAAVVDKVTSKFISSGINKPMVRISADARQIDKDTLEGMIAQIYSTKNNRMNKLIENIITVYFSKNPTSMKVSSGEFLNFGFALYRSIGTSKDPMLMEIKSILAYWMNDIINIRSMYQREATVINYTRGIFDYIILMINYSAD